MSCTLTKASRTSRACSMLRGVETVSPLVMSVRLVRQFIRSLTSTLTHRDTKTQELLNESPKHPIKFTVLKYCEIIA